MHVKNAEKEQLERNFSLWKAAAYVRLSKEDKKKVESDSIGTQKEIIKEYLKLHPDILDASLTALRQISQSQYLPVISDLEHA